jgi:hypothetical protein|tara:strand:+ start:399 stop:518 length:120 start_codon:yes stop_codon:yes gene_type:complete
MSVLFETKNLSCSDGIHASLVNLKEKLDVCENKEIENEC